MGAISAANLTRLRTTRHATKLAMVAYPPATIWSCEVDGSPDSIHETTFAVNNVVTNYFTPARPPQKNYWVWLGSTAGAKDLGVARFKSYAAPNITLGEHNALIVDGVYISVKEEVKPTSIHCVVDDNDVVFEDKNTAYTNENTQYMPLAKCGTHPVAYLDSVTGLATVQFYDHGSEAFNGATIASVLWVWQGGTVTVGSTVTPGTAGVPNVVTWNATGNYYCSYTVTDSNGKTHTRYFVVFVRQRDQYVFEAGLEVFTWLEVEGIEGDVESGTWSTRVRIYGNTAETTLAEEALVVLFAEDWFGDEYISIGHELYRENIVLSGYIRAGTIKRNWASGYVEFDIASVSGLMDNLSEIGGGLETYTAGENTLSWHVLTAMTYNLAAHHLLTQHSTISQVCDVFLNLPDYTIEFVDVLDTSLGDALRQIFAAVRSRMGCTKEGALYLEVNPQIQSFTAPRSTTYVITTTNADYRDDLDFGDENAEKQVSQIDFEGLDENAEPLFALAPLSPWASGKAERIDGIRVAGQLESNEFSGLYEGWRNNEYSDIVIPWRGNYRSFDIFPAEPIAVNLTAAKNPRGDAWTNVRCWIKRVTFDYRDTILTTTTVVERDAYGNPGFANTYPGTPPIIPPPEPPPQQPNPPPPQIPYPPPQGGGAWIPNVYLLTDHGVYYTSNFSGPGGAMPTWTLINGGLPGGCTYKWLQPDPYRSGTRQYLLITNAGVDELYVRTGGAWSKLTDGTALGILLRSKWGGRLTGVITIDSFQTDINADGYIGVFGNMWGQNLSLLMAYQVYVYFWSTDFGVTWNLFTYPAPPNLLPRSYLGNISTLQMGQIGDFAGSSGFGGGQVIYYPLGRPANLYSYLYRSTDKGNTWSIVVNNTFDFTAAAFNTDVYQDVLYCLQFGGSRYFIRSANSGATWTADLLDAAMVVNATYKSPYRFHALYNPTGSYSSILRVTDDDCDIWKSVNSGATWTQYTHDATATGHMHELGISLCHDSDGKIYGFSLNSTVDSDRAIWASADEGVTWEAKAGNNCGASPYADSIPGHARAIAILQVFN